MQRIQRADARERINACCLVEVGDQAKVAVVVASRTMLTLHDAETGNLLREFVGHQSEVMAVAVSPDGQLLASAALDQTLRLWSLKEPGERRNVIGERLAKDGASNRVETVADGMAAAAAGVKPGDAILLVNDTPIKVQSDLIRALAETGEGGAAQLQLQRGSSTVRVTIRPKRTVVADRVEPLLSIFSARNGQWVAWTPCGYYAASPGGDSLFGWQVNRGQPYGMAPDVQAEFHSGKSFQAALYRPEIGTSSSRAPAKEIGDSAEQCN